jgi:hypothetical protein
MNFARTGVAQDPVVERDLRNLIQQLNSGKFSPEQLNLVLLAAAIGPYFQEGHIVYLDRVLKGLEVAHKLVVDAGAAAGFALTGNASIVATTDTAQTERAQALRLQQVTAGGSGGGPALKTINAGPHDTIADDSGAKLTYAGEWTDTGGDSPTSNRALIDAMQATIDDHEARIAALEGP